MKILKKGIEKNGWAHKEKCTGKGNGGGGCGAILLVEENDLYHTYAGHYDGSTDVFVTFTCACCGVEMDIKVPTTINLKVRDKKA